MELEWSCQIFLRPRPQLADSGEQWKTFRAYYIKFVIDKELKPSDRADETRRPAASNTNERRGDMITPSSPQVRHKGITMPLKFGDEKS